MKRLSLLLLCVVLSFSVALGYHPTPTRAESASLASFFPEKTFVFGEADTSDLPGLLKMGVDLVTKFGYPVPANWQSMLADMYTQQFKRKVDLQKDLIGWIGDRAAIGIYVPDALFTINAQRASGQNAPQPLSVALIRVKDEGRADAFLADMLSKAPEVTNLEVKTAGGETVTIYKFYDTETIARWDGYLAIGNVALLLDTLRDNKPALSNNPQYQKMIHTLKPGTLASVFVRTPFAPNSLAFTTFVLALLGPAIGNTFQNIVMSLQGTPTPTPSPTPPPSPDEQRLIDTLLELGSSIYSVRSEGNALILDLTVAFDPDMVKQLGNILNIDLQSALSMPRPVSGSLLDAIPADASAVIVGSDLPQIYHSLVPLLVGAQKAFLIIERKSPSDVTVEMAQSQVETSIRGTIGLDLNEDFLGWATGDYALYVSEDKGGTVEKLSQGQLPLAENILVTSTDPARAQAATDGLVKLISKRNSQPVPQAGADGLYPVTLGTGITVNMGVVDSTFVLTTDSDFTLTPAKTLTSTQIWKNAEAQLPKSYSQLFFLDTVRLSALLASMAASGSNASNQMKQYMAALKPFESAWIVYSQQEPGMGTSTFMLMLK